MEVSLTHSSNKEQSLATFHFFLRSGSVNENVVIMKIASPPLPHLPSFLRGIASACITSPSTSCSCPLKPSSPSLRIHPFLTLCLRHHHNSLLSNTSQHCHHSPLAHQCLERCTFPVIHSIALAFVMAATATFVAMNLCKPHTSSSTPCWRLQPTRPFGAVLIPRRQPAGPCQATVSWRTTSCPLHSTPSHGPPGSLSSFPSSTSSQILSRVAASSDLPPLSLLLSYS
jgi:hypothetical protein